MALGMISAVIFLSMRTISEKGRTSCTVERMESVSGVIDWSQDRRGHSH